MLLVGLNALLLMAGLGALVFFMLVRLEQQAKSAGADESQIELVAPVPAPTDRPGDWPSCDESEVSRQGDDPCLPTRPERSVSP